MRIPVSKVLVIVISHPIDQSEPRVADTPGIAAHAAALKKENLYYNKFVIPAGHMVPLSAETGGRFDATFSKFLKEVVTSGLDFGESPVPVWTKEKRALFASRLRSAHEAGKLSLMIKPTSRCLELKSSKACI